ncbi:MAG: adenylate/guanylate cyclase domain-containing protein [Bacteroidota bacterium]
MADIEIKDIIGKKILRFKERLHIKDLQLNILLEITNAISSNLSTLEILEKFERFVKDELKIEKLILFAKYKRWRCILDYGVEDNELDKFDVKRDLIELQEITSVTSLDNEIFKTFDMVVPVYYGEKPLAYLILGDITEEAVGVSSIIKHLNFLKLLTNIIVSAIENQRLAQETLRQEREKKEMMEKQNEILEMQVAERTKELRAEKDESERLLHNILPIEVADELKQKGKVAPQYHKQVTMLFTDFKDFTKTSAKISAKLLVNELNDIFENFDSIMAKYGVEKIKTIGDAYMAACGIPKKNNLHALQCIRAAQEMIEYLDLRGKTSEIKWRMRVGIHSGPLVAGVVGAKKFTYDVWGDTVNTAARMESNGEPGKINISANTHMIIKNHFDCTYRGKIVAKGKGEIDMYFIECEKEKPEFIKLKEFILNKLKKELPSNLSYHGVHHTVDVYNSAINIALSEKTKKEEIELLKIAALFHDSGFIKTYKGHEEESCKIARSVLPRFNFSKKQIDVVCGMIMATQVPQNPKNHLEKIICDADLDYLGRDDFYQISETLFKELNAVGIEMDEIKWNEIQLKFLESHHYFTKTTKSLRQPVKQKYIEKIRGIVESYKSYKALKSYL